MKKKNVKLDLVSTTVGMWGDGSFDSVKKKKNKDDLKKNQKQKKLDLIPE